MNIDSKNNISMTRGDSETITVSCKDRPFVEGDVIAFTVRKGVKNQVKNIAKKVTTFDENGKAIIEIKPEDTAGMDFTTYKYDIQLTAEDGTVSTIIKPADFTLTEEVSYE